MKELEIAALAREYAEFPYPNPEGDNCFRYSPELTGKLNIE